VAYANVYLAKLKENGNIDIQQDLLRWYFACKNVLLTAF